MPHLTRPALVLLVLLPLGCDRPPATPPAAPAKAAAPKLVYEREELERLVKGMTEDEVRAAVGDPNHVRRVGPLTGWFYDLRTRDPETGKLDDTAGVMFGPDGKVLGVEW